MQVKPVIQTNKKIKGESFTAEELRLVHGGKEYFDLLLTLINEATASIHLQTYIFDDDETGMMVASALKNAANRKVDIYLLADGYASQSLSKSFIRSLKDAGIHFRYFEPLFRSKYFYFGRRMHHKILVVDTEHALVGGINIADRYNDCQEQKAWLDFALYLTGNIVKELCVLCWKTWNGFPQKIEKFPCDGLQTPEKTQQPKKMPVVLRRNDWVHGKNQISRSYIGMLEGAESQVIILCSYFLPGKIIRKCIERAIKRGVKVTIITAGSSDVKLAKNAERWLYDWLLRNDVGLYEYQESILHGKLAVCDERWLTIGSYNLNDISAFASVELNIDVYDGNFTREVKQTLLGIMQDHCIRITPDHHARTRNIFVQFIRWISYRTIRTVFHVFTFYYKRQR